jgi:hypothetical protein
MSIVGAPGVCLESVESRRQRGGHQGGKCPELKRGLPVERISQDISGLRLLLAEIAAAMHPVIKGREERPELHHCAVNVDRCVLYAHAKASAWMSRWGGRFGVSQTRYWIKSSIVIQGLDRHP